uniref:Uncharacterized protein n=1 Tax=Gracilariopsis andersonii TaxID=172979 RepID=F2Z7J1_9FLOR|nr:hypothetical protein [Gracilariopsis andersonii]
MKLLILCSFSAFIVVFIASAANVREVDEIEIINEQCDVPPVVAYCLDMVHLGSNINKNSSQSNGELQHDVEEIPVGMCAWGDWAGKVSAKQCVQILKEYAAAEEEEKRLRDRQNDTETTKTSSRFFRLFGLGFSSFFKSRRRGGNRSARRVGSTVRRVARSCGKISFICESAADMGIGLLPVPRFSNNFNFSLL